MYFTSEHDEAVVKWKTASTQEQYRIYKLLYQPLMYMAKSILPRYFKFNSSLEDELITTAITELFINLHHYDPDLNKKPYSYCQTIIKNYYHNAIVYRKKKAVSLEYYDDLPIRFEYHTCEPEIQVNDFKPVFKRLEEAKSKFITYLDSKNVISNKQRNRLNNEILLLQHTIDFIQQYKDSSMTLDALSDYLMIKTKLHFHIVGLFLKEHLGVGKYVNDDRPIRMDEKIKNSIGIINDDYTPDVLNEVRLMKNMVKRKIIINEHRFI